MIQACERQVRAAFRGIYALDFGAVIAFAQARGAMTPFLAELLPEIEPYVVAHYHVEAGEED